jgi:hypothetical protein
MIGTAPLGAALIVAVGALHVARADEPSRISSMSIEKLKDVYQGCEQAAKTGRLNGSDVMYCSLVYEELKEKAFGGEFRRIRSWLDRNCLSCSPHA